MNDLIDEWERAAIKEAADVAWDGFAASSEIHADEAVGVRFRNALALIRKVKALLKEELGQ